MSNKKEKGPIARKLGLLREKYPLVFINFVPAAIAFFLMSMLLSVLIFAAVISGGTEKSVDLIKAAFTVFNYFTLGIFIFPPLMMVVNLVFNIRRSVYRFFDNMLYASGALSFMYILAIFVFYLYRGYFNSIIENQSQYIVWSTAVSLMTRAVIVSFILCMTGFVVGQVILLFEKKVRVPMAQKKENEKR